MRSFIFVLLLSLQLFATNKIPTLPTDCLKKVEHLIDGSIKGEALKALAIDAQTVTASEDFATLLVRAKEANLRPGYVFDTLINSAYVIEMDITKPQLAQAIKEFYESAGLHENATHVMQKVFPGYRNGFKKFATQREYDLATKIIAIKNQDRLGSCWAYAGLTYIENIMAQMFPNTPFSVELFYANYIANIMKRQLKEKYIHIDTLEKAILPDSELFSEGNNFGNFMALIQEFGMAPESAYKPIKEYQTRQWKDKLMRDLRELLEDYYKARKELGQKSSSWFGGLSKADISRKIKALNRKTANDIEELMESYAGPLQPEFEFEGRIYTPKSFYHEHVANNFQVLRRYRKSSYSNPGWETTNTVSIYDENLKSSYPQFRVQSNSLDRAGFKELVTETINNGKPLYIAIDVPVSSYTDANGVTHKIIDGNTGLSTLRDVQGNPKIRGGHALVVTGYELDHSGNLKTLKIQNSWGDSHGDNGFLHFDESFIWKYMRHMSILD